MDLKLIVYLSLMGLNSYLKNKAGIPNYVRIDLVDLCLKPVRISDFLVFPGIFEVLSTNST
jgi:hypothetical protein